MGHCLSLWPVVELATGTFSYSLREPRLVSNLKSPIADYVNHTRFNEQSHFLDGAIPAAFNRMHQI